MHVVIKGFDVSAEEFVRVVAPPGGNVLRFRCNFDPQLTEAFNDIQSGVHDFVFDFGARGTGILCGYVKALKPADGSKPYVELQMSGPPKAVPR